MTDLVRIQSARPERIAALLGHGLSTALVETWAARPRLRQRLSAVAASRLGSVGALGRRHSVALALTSEDLSELVLVAGAIWQARAVTRIIDGPSRRALMALLGPRAYALALEGQHLAAPEQPSDLTFESIAERAPTAGAACLQAWCDACPAPVSRRVALALPEVDVDIDHRRHGPAIVDWLLDRR